MATDNTAHSITSTIPSVPKTWLGLDSSFWDVALVIGLATAAVVAFVVVVTTLGSIITHKREAAEAQRELATANERISANEAATERAKADAESARAGAANATARVAEAERGMAEAKARAVAAEASIAKANERIAKAQATAATANEQSARVEEAARWRVLSPKSKVSLVTALAKGPGGAVTLAWPANDPESLFLTRQLEDAFEAANVKAGKTLWTVGFEPRVYSHAIFWNLRIIGQSAVLVGALRRIFSEAEIPNSHEMIPNVINDSPGMVISGGGLQPALIWVGPKRPPT